MLQIKKTDIIQVTLLNSTRIPTQIVGTIRPADQLVIAFFHIISSIMNVIKWIFNFNIKLLLVSFLDNLEILGSTNNQDLRTNEALEISHWPLQGNLFTTTETNYNPMMASSKLYRQILDFHWKMYYLRYYKLFCSFSYIFSFVQKFSLTKFSPFSSILFMFALKIIHSFMNYVE